jgi:DNA-damage-inducible protein J
MATSILRNDSEHSTMDETSALMSALRALNEDAIKNGSAGMSEEEIEAEIKAARAERR